MCYNSIPNSTSSQLKDLLLQMLKRNPQDRINFEDFSTHVFLTNNDSENFSNSYENNFIEQQQQQQQQKQQSISNRKKSTNRLTINEEKFLNIDSKKKTKPQNEEITGTKSNTFYIIPLGSFS